MGKDEVLTKVAVGDVANELEYHSSCLTGFCRRFDNFVDFEDDFNAPDTRSLEEVLSQIDEDVSEGR